MFPTALRGASSVTYRDGEPNAMRLLVVDDDPANATLISSLLTDADPTTNCVAVRFAEAEAAIISRTFDAYLIGNEPGASDWVALIESTEGLVTGPFVLLSGTTGDDIAEHSMVGGKIDLIDLSGLTPRALVRTLRYAVGAWQSARKIEADLERASSLFDGAPVGIFRVSSNNRLLEVNKRTVALLGYPDRETLLGAAPLEMHLSLDHLDADMASLRAGNEVDMRLRRYDGTTMWATLNLHPVLDESGAISHYDGAILDSTRRHAAEYELALRDSILDQVPVAVIQTDASGVVSGWNGQAEAMYGWSAEEALGSHIGDLTVPPEDLDRAAEIMDAIATDGLWQGEYLARRKDGSTFPIHVRHSNVRDARGNPVGVVGVSQDLSEQQSAHQTLALRVEQQAALAQLSRLAVDTHGVEEFLRQATELIARTLRADTVEIFQVGKSSDELSMRAGAGATGLQPGSRLSAHPETLLGLTLKLQSSILAIDLQDDPRFSQGHPTPGIRSSVTSLIGNGAPWGVLAVLSNHVGKFRDEDVYFVESSANLVAAVIDRARADEHRNRLAEILENTTDYVATADSDKRVTYANKAALAAAGVDSDRNINGLGIDAFQPEWALELIAREGFPTALASGVWSGQTAFSDPVLGEVPTLQVIIAHSPREDGTVWFSTVARDLTDALDAERRLGESQALVGQAFFGASEGKALLDLEGHFVTVNEALAKFLGYETQDLIGLHHSQITHPDDVELGVDEIAQMIDGELAEVQTEKRYIRADGSTRWGMVRVSLISGTDGKPEYRFAQIADIDSRRKAEQQIRFQASLLDEVNNAVIATDLEGKVTFWNRFAETMFGWAADEALGQELFPLIAPNAEIGDLTAVLATALLEDGKWEGEGLLSRRDGSDFPAYMSDSLLTNDAGVPVGVVGVKVDLTETKQTEAAARRQGEMAESVLQSVRFPVAVLDGKGVITAVNHAWSQFAIDNDGDADRTGVGVDYLDVTRNAGDDEYAAQAFAGITSVLVGDIGQFTLDYPCPDGENTQRWFELDVTSMPGDGAVVTHWDITDELAARTALEETIRTKDKFIASLSHELRTPLTAIVGLTQLLKDRSYSPAETAEFHTVIAEQSQEISLLVEDLLVAARIDSETLTLQIERVDVGYEIERVIAPWLSQGVSEIEMKSPVTATVFADAGRFRQVIRNLLLNAIRHGAAPIEFYVTSGRGGVCIAVVDQGVGVPENALEEMFQPYATFGGDATQPASVGLGLHVSRSLAEQMGGSLTYHRRDGKTVFELILPGSIHR